MRYLILGCGWVGEFVANLWLKEGHEVWASTTTEQKYHRLQADGIFVFRQNFDEDAALSHDVPMDFDYVLISVPATSKSTIAELTNRFINLEECLSKLIYKKIIFLSSIGIYPDVSSVIDEETFEENELQPKLLLAERAILKFPRAHVFRLGGLFGQNRIFAKYFQMKVCTTGGQPANFIHLEDVAAIISQGFVNPLRYTIYNVVCPNHPLKKDVIQVSAKKYGFDQPSAFNDIVLFEKIVRSARVQNDLNYTFKYESPLDF